MNPDKALAYLQTHAVCRMVATSGRRRVEHRSFLQWRFTHSVSSWIGIWLR
jgi:hypothetical protein